MHRAILAIAASICLATAVQARPQDFSPQQLDARLGHRRAGEAVVWGMPAVNYRLMYEEMARQVGGGVNQILWWPGRLAWQNQTLTPNSDGISLLPFFNTKDVGPVVLEIPPADQGLFNGSVMTYWQAAIEDVGPGGMDTGKGGKYLFLPPGEAKEKVPDGSIPMQSDTSQGVALLRSVLKSGSDADVAKAVAQAKRVKLSPLSPAASPPETKGVDASQVVFDSQISYDLRFFQVLHRQVQDEPWLERDRAMIDPLKSIGIERGQPFNPAACTQKIRNDAIREAHAWLDAKVEQFPPYYQGGRWFFPITEEMPQSVMSCWRTPDSFPVDVRGTGYTLAFFSGLHVGENQYYLRATTDRRGHPLRGDASQRLRVPANVPVNQYGSMTVSNRATHTFLQNARGVGRSSQTPGLQKNVAGSMDLSVGPQPPPSGESNWVPTDPTGRFEVLARFYGPEKPLFDTSWKLNDIEALK